MYTIGLQGSLIMVYYTPYMDVSENSGTPQIIHFNRVFHYFHHPFWDTLIFGNIHIAGQGFIPLCHN